MKLIKSNKEYKTENLYKKLKENIKEHIKLLEENMMSLFIDFVIIVSV